MSHFFCFSSFTCLITVPPFKMSTTTYQKSDSALTLNLREKPNSGKRPTNFKPRSNHHHNTFSSSKSKSSSNIDVEEIMNPKSSRRRSILRSFSNHFSRSSTMVSQAFSSADSKTQPQTKDNYHQTSIKLEHTRRSSLISFMFDSQPHPKQHKQNNHSNNSHTGVETYAIESRNRQNSDSSVTTQSATSSENDDLHSFLGPKEEFSMDSNLNVDIDVEVNNCHKHQQTDSFKTCVCDFKDLEEDNCSESILNEDDINYNSDDNKENIRNSSESVDLDFDLFKSYTDVCSYLSVNRSSRSFISDNDENNNLMHNNSFSRSPKSLANANDSMLASKAYSSHSSPLSLKNDSDAESFSTVQQPSSELEASCRPFRLNGRNGIVKSPALKQLHNFKDLEISTTKNEDKVLNQTGNNNMDTEVGEENINSNSDTESKIYNNADNSNSEKNLSLEHLQTLRLENVKNKRHSIMIGSPIFNNTNSLTLDYALRRSSLSPSDERKDFSVQIQDLQQQNRSSSPAAPKFKIRERDISGIFKRVFMNGSALSLSSNHKKKLLRSSLFDIIKLENNSIPLIILSCLKEVKKRGLDEEGIYRKSGRKFEVDEILEQFESYLNYVFDKNHNKIKNEKKLVLKLLNDMDINSVTGALKEYLRRLPEPLLKFENYNEFLSIAKDTQQESQLDKLKTMISQLSEPHYNCFKILMEHLSLIAENSNLNRMSSKSLAIVFAPTLTWDLNSDKDLDFLNLPSKSIIIGLIIDNYNFIFSSGSESSGAELSDSITPESSKPLGSSTNTNDSDDINNKEIS